MEVIFRNVSFSYNKGLENESVALSDVNMCLDSNLIHGIIGPIGSGKSTMLELMNGITKPTNGQIIIGKYDLSSNGKNFDFNKFRYDVGLVYQFPEKQFFCRTVGEEVSFSEKIHNHKNVKGKVVKVLKMVGLDESYLNRSPFNLNGGEKRRVAIASVLISNPKLLIMDEPTIGLDNNSKKRLMKLLRNLKTRYGKTIIIVTHDVDMLYEIVDSVIVLNNGKIICSGKKLDVFSNVQLLDDNNTPVPSVIRFEKMLFDKTGIDLGYCSGINELVRTVANYER